MKSDSKRAQIRDAAEQVLRVSREPMHVSQFAPDLLQSLAIEDYSVKDVNTSLHDDPGQRFIRVGKGTWTLRDFKH